MRYFFTLSSLVILASMVACGGKSSSTPSLSSVQAASLNYVNPTQGPGEWALVKDTQGSTSTRLVLDLIGPQGALYRGIGFNLATDTSMVSFSKFTDSNGNSLGYMADGSVLHDLDENSNPVSCLTRVAGTKGTMLSVGIFQKCLNYTLNPAYGITQGSYVMNSAMDCSTRPVLQIALELVKGAAPGVVTLSVPKAAVLPENVANLHHAVATTVRVGTLALN